jgi:LPXTG-motif cell wall-anchored protein
LQISTSRCQLWAYPQERGPVYYEEIETKEPSSTPNYAIIGGIIVVGGAAFFFMRKKK